MFPDTQAYSCAPSPTQRDIQQSTPLGKPMATTSCSRQTRGSSCPEVPQQIWFPKDFRKLRGKEVPMSDISWQCQLSKERHQAREAGVGHAWTQSCTTMKVEEELASGDARSWNILDNQMANHIFSLTTFT